jgi:hypothetical protein
MREERTCDCFSSDAGKTCDNLKSDIGWCIAECSAGPSAAGTYSAAVKWKRSTLGRFKFNIDAYFSSNLNGI